MTKWPIWCEYAGLLIAIILIIEGLRIKNYFIILLGILKLRAHFQQLLYDNDKYYY